MSSADGTGSVAAGVAFLLFLSACTHTVELVNLKDGTTIPGVQRFWDQSITLALPAGETVTGSYTKLTTIEIGKGSLFYGANVGELLGRQATERVYGYARLTGERGTVVEIVFTSDWLGRGYGVARTSLKEEYRVTF